MKLSKRETIMIVVLLFVICVSVFWFLILSPAFDSLKALDSEYQTIKAQDDANKAVIANVKDLEQTQSELVSNIGKVESSLLPELDSEVIVEHFAKIFQDNGLPFIIDITCDPVATQNLLLTNGTYSNDKVRWIRVHMTVSGTDGVTPGGIPEVGYDEFIKAVKVIESVNPDAIQIHSLSMTDTSQGFQYYTVAVDVFAFVLPDRVNEVDLTQPYTTWDRADAPLGGLMGIPYAQVSPSQLNPSEFRPFAASQTAAATPAETVSAA